MRMSKIMFTCQIGLLPESYPVDMTKVTGEIKQENIMRDKIAELQAKKSVIKAKDNKGKLHRLMSVGKLISLL